jgi:hypothetical protein
MAEQVQIVSRREKIVEEFRKRLAAVFPESTFFRGLPDEAITSYDVFYLLDMPESCTLDIKHRGMYHCFFTISITYWIQMSKEDVYPAGNYLMEKIRLAIEQDERLSGLVISYSLDEGALVWYDEGVLDVELLYMVEYTKDAGWVSNPFKP